MIGITPPDRKQVKERHLAAIEELLEDGDSTLFEVEILDEQETYLLDDIGRGLEIDLEDSLETFTDTGEDELDRFLDEEAEVAPGFRRGPKPPEPSYTEQFNIFERDPSPGEKRLDNWHSPLYEPEEYEPDEYRHPLVA